jgi:diadenosine tetraphosphatase ApaH/serine/threonine PP2A family protein phosphatase
LTVGGGGRHCPAMRIALMSDIHSNREAFAACLAHAAAAGVERHVFLGDFVGYGADPEWVVATVMEHVANGAIAIAGNHDRAIGIERGGMNDTARRAIDWTRSRLDASATAFLAGLPLENEAEDRLYVHADASAPGQWRYVDDGAMAAASLAATRQRVTFCGHVHVPMLFDEDGGGPLADGTPAVLSSDRRWLAVVGSVGQPRDRNPAAAYAIYDTVTTELRGVRVGYDIAAASAKIRAVGLPEALAVRLALGR